jgi:zinc protease
MLNSRLDEIAQAPNAPFLGAQTGRGLFVNAEEATNLDALVPPGGVERGLTALFTEVDRVARFGFTATELNREKLNVMRFFQGALVEKEQTPSPQLADEFVRNFMQAEPIPGITYEYGLNERFLPEITLAEVNALAKDWMPDRNRLVVVSAPEKDKATLPNETRIAAVIKGATGAPLTAYVDTVSTQPLLPMLPMPGAIAATSTNAAAGITEWRLSNGVRVILKPTTFKQDEIIFRAVSPGGTSLASDADYIPAATAAQVMAEGGLGSIKRLDLEKILAGSTAAVRADIGQTEEALGGGATRKDLETMFQLVYLTFTAPRADPVAFGVLTDRLKIALANQESMPETVFNQAMQAALSQNNVRALPMTPARVAQMDLNKSLAFYKDRFADASDFIFVFVGSFDLQTMKPLVERYLASLPSLRRNDVVRDVGAHPPSGVVQRTVRSGIEPRSQVSIVFSGAFQNDELHRVVARSMGEMLSGNLQRTLREDLGGTYGVSVEPSFTKLPTEEYRFNISFACDPARTDVLTKAAFQVIEDFKNNGPTQGQVNDAKSALTRDLETFSRQNEYYLNRILYKYEYGEDVNEVFNMPQIYSQLSALQIRDAARAYLNTNRYVQVTLVPQGR